ncbi:hypothetical protein ACFW2K_33505 [Streptomyces nigra]|uniref:hypothetical protein n=1 Tax=Streptomyces nigra TaxID=1827580 RepID=UPI003694F77E
MTGRFRRNTVALLSASVLAVGGSLTMGAGAASAADSVTFSTSTNSNGREIDVFVNGAYAGSANWFEDPEAGWDGDLLTAYDAAADGYGIEAHLSTGRIATTAGHNSPYTDKASGDLPEGNTYTMWVCAVKSGFSKCSSQYSVTA